MKSRILLSLLVAFSFNINAQELTELYEKVSPSVVQILVKSETSEGTGDPYVKVVSGGLGTGVVISDKGEILTAAHVVGTASEIQVIFKDGFVSSAKIVKSSSYGDVALIRLNRVPRNIQPAKIADSDKVKIGQNIFVIGFPMGLSYSLSKGIISARRNDGSLVDAGITMEFFQTDAAINTGNSGGPMFNYKGEVIAIVSAILSRSGGFEGIGFAATSNLAKNVLFQEDRFWFGIDGQYVEGTLAKVLNIPQDGGLMVSSVTPNSPAYYLGLRGGYLSTEIAGTEVMLGGDIILSMEGQKIDSENSMKEVFKILHQKKKRDEVKFKVLRDGEIKEHVWKIK